MNGNGESMRADIRRESTAHDPATLERRSDAIRQDVGATLDALQRNYSPGALLDRSIDLFKEHGGELGANLGRSVKENPVPALLTLVGIGWMMVSQGRQDDARGLRRDDYDAEDDGARLDVGAAPYAPGATVDDTAVAIVAVDGDAADADASGRSVSDRLGAARDGARHAKDSVVGSVRGGAHRVSERSHRAAERARERSARARDGMRTMLQEQPFLVGALGIAVGAAIGAMLPESEREDRALGRARDRVLDRARELGTQGYARVREKGAQAAEGAREATDGSRLGGGAGGDATATPATGAAPPERPAAP